MVQPEDSYAKVERARKRYQNSEKGKETRKRYDHSEKRKQVREKYLESEKGKQALLRYYLSEKAETTRQQRQALLKLFRQIHNYLQENPEKTLEEGLEQLTQEKE